MIYLKSDSPFFDIIYDILQDLVSQSKLLKVSLKERSMLETVLRDCDEWKNDASSLLQETAQLFDVADICDGSVGIITSRTDCLVARIESVIKKGFSFGFDLDEIPKLKDACSALHWCKNALSFCSGAPSFKVTNLSYDDMMSFMVSSHLELYIRITCF